MAFRRVGDAKWGWSRAGVNTLAVPSDCFPWTCDAVDSAQRGIVRYPLAQKLKLFVPSGDMKTRGDEAQTATHADSMASPDRRGTHHTGRVSKSIRIKPFTRDRADGCEARYGANCATLC